MRIKNPDTSEIAYLEDKFNLTDCEGNIIKSINLDELKKWIKFEETIELLPKEKEFIQSCLDNLIEAKFNEITHVLREGRNLHFCKYENNKIVWVEIVRVKGFDSIRENVVYSLNELGI